MRIPLFLGAAALIGFAAAQDNPCESDDPPSWCPPLDPCLGEEPPEYCSDPCMGESPPEDCGPPSGDPCLGPEPPWFCPGVGYYEEPFTFEEDAETGFRFSQYKAVYTLDDRRIIYRVARPETVPQGQAFDVVFQIQAPADVGWAALAWGGTMLSNPLTVVWANCSNMIISSRWAGSHTHPIPYDGATYEILEQATFINETHYQVTARCTGCTTWLDPDLGRVTIDAYGMPEFAWAYAIQEPNDPTMNTSEFGFHDAHGIWANNMTENGNVEFAGLIAKNLALTAAREPPANGTCLYTKPEPTDGRTTITKTVTETGAATETVSVTVTETVATATTTVTVTTGSGLATITATSVTTVTAVDCPMTTKPAAHNWY